MGPSPVDARTSDIVRTALGRPAILAVDDQPANLIAIESIVDPLGHELVAVETGLEALNAASTREFAAILLDVAMPGLDGFQTLARLREIPTAQGTPVVLLTAHRFEPAMVQRAYALGAVDYLEKPISNELLRGKLASFVALFEQRTEITRQDEALRIKDRHMGILAHDMRAPMATALQATRQLMRHDDLTVRISAERIARSADHLQQLMEDLLSAARAATAIRLRRQQLDLSLLVDELVEDFRATYGGVRFSSALACNVHGAWDAGRLRQALSNLLGNAVKYGDGWVTAETRCNDSEAWISIENGGQPLSREQLAQIAQPPTLETLKSEAGLGLLVAKEIAAAHGGSLRAEATPGRSRLILTLPIVTARGAAAG